MAQRRGGLHAAVYGADFAATKPDAAEASRQLGAVGRSVGVALTPDLVELPGLTFKAAEILAYDHAALGEIVLTDASGDPNLFCILAGEAPAAPVSVEQRGELILASWAKGGRRFLVVGRNGERVAEWARTLASRS